MADNPADGADIGLRLSEHVGRDDELPALRVGVAYGSVVNRLGDIYGEPVNLASRLTGLARPGSVLIDRELAGKLDGDERFRLRRAAPRPVRGYATVFPVRLRRADDSSGRSEPH